MTERLKEALRSISSELKSEAELDFGVRVLIGFARCLLSMRQEIMENESNNINSCFDQDAGRRLELDCSK
jgi:hypothetical protein